MNTENNNTNLDDASELIPGSSLPAELVEIAGGLDALAASHRAELSTAALVAMARATRPSAGGTPLRLVGEPLAVGSSKSGWSWRGRAIGGLLAMAASVALVVAIWPAAGGGNSGGGNSGGGKPGSDLVATTGGTAGVDAAMQIASSVDDKLSLEEFDALLAEADAIGNLSLETDGKNAS